MFFMHSLDGETSRLSFHGNTPLLSLQITVRLPELTDADYVNSRAFLSTSRINRTEHYFVHVTDYFSGVNVMIKNTMFFEPES